jgi:hypothetical protein
MRLSSYERHATRAGGNNLGSDFHQLSLGLVQVHKVSSELMHELRQGSRTGESRVHAFVLYTHI